MSKETSSTIFKKLVNSPVGIIAEFIVNKLATEYGYEPLRNYFLEIQTGKTPPMSNPEYYSSNDIEWIKPSDIGFEKYISASDWISIKALKENKATIYKPNTVLIICIGGGIGRLGIVDKICSSNQQITGILFKNEVLAEFVYYFFLSRYKIFEENSSKSTLPIINQKGLGNLDFTCPENSVQKVVVRYLDYCKKCLDEFIYPSNSDFELNSEILAFANKAFKAYYTQRSLLAEYSHQLTLLDSLNQAILQEAVQGKLTASWRSSHPELVEGNPELVEGNPELVEGTASASELLKRIKLSRVGFQPDPNEINIGLKPTASSINRAGFKPRPIKELPPIKPEEIPFDIPENWAWCRLGEIAESTSGGTPDRSNPKYWNGNISWLKSGELTDGIIGNESEEKITEEGFKNSSAKLFPQGTLLIALYGATAGKLGILKFESTTNQAVCGFFENEFYVTKYLFYYLGAFRRKIIEDSWGQAQPNISQTYLKNLPIAFPPLSEQKRIVAEIEKQLAKTKQLKELVLANQVATEQLLKALLHQAFLPAEAAAQAGEIKENDLVKA